MSNTFMRRRRPFLLYLILGAVGMCVMVAVGLAIQVMNEPKTPSDLHVPAAVPVPGSVTGIGPSGTPIPGQVGPLRTIPGSRSVGDLSVGYPHTPVGAVSAAVYYWSQLSSTLDVERATTIIKLISDPAWTTAIPEIRSGRTETRKALGLSQVGPVPDGASVLFTPLMYQVRNIQADSMDVLLLGYYETSQPGQQPSTKSIIFPTKIRWVGGDWKLPAQTLNGNYSPLMAKPGTNDALDKSWQPLNT